MNVAAVVLLLIAELQSLINNDSERARRDYLRKRLKTAQVPRPAYCQ